jgi:hypothetical protein
MPTETQLEGITHTIQLAVAPVFLLSSIGMILSVLANRLGRVVDRARRVEEGIGQAENRRRGSLDELRPLSQRAHLIHVALTCGTVAALLVCLLIAVAFVGYLLNVNFGVFVAVLFILAMAALVTSLVFFLREVFIAIATLEFQLPEAVTKRK